MDKGYRGTGTLDEQAWTGGAYLAGLNATENVSGAGEVRVYDYVGAGPPAADDIVFRMKVETDTSKGETFDGGGEKGIKLSAGAWVQTDGDIELILYRAG